MRDTREKALERAKQRTQGSASSAAFESERQRAAEARRAEVGTYTGQNVQMIRASSASAAETKILRVAAYCRVSTDDIDQVISIELQKKNYTEMIRANPKWKYVGTYVDNGISGTNTEHRPGFTRMMQDALNGKIDMIITKAVSRFARNLIDCINWVRRLQKHDPPIAVFFEQENLNTLDNTSNIILFVLAMVAEEESHMKSEAMLLSLEWRFSRGRFLIPPLLGYDKAELVDTDGIKKKMLVVNEEQAVIVRYMYYSLLNGVSPAEIADNLTIMGLETGGRKRDGTPNTHWTAGSVVSILRNERYCGDVLARKTWTPDFHDHKSKKNNGKKNKYYHPGHHEAIVTRTQWNAAQRILNSFRYNCTGGYKPMQVVENGVLCGFISINRGWAGFSLNDYYRVSSIVLGLADGTPEENLAEKYLPEGGYALADTMGENGVQRIARQLSEAEQEVKDQLEGHEAVDEEAAPQPPPRTRETMRRQFQVISGEFFSHNQEPTLSIRKNSILFNKACTEKLQPLPAQAEEAAYAEILLNPVERILAVRPCSREHPNAIRWTDSKHKACSLGASVFCGMLYEMQGWSEDCTYRIPASVRSNGTETVLFFDLDNATANQKGKRMEALREQLSAIENASEPEATGALEDDSYFFGAEEDELPDKETAEAMQDRLRELISLERVTFGTPLAEHVGGSKVATLDGSEDWNVMVQARALGEDHSVAPAVVQALEDTLLERSEEGK